MGQPGKTNISLTENYFPKQNIFHGEAKFHFSSHVSTFYKYLIICFIIKYVITERFSDEKGVNV